MTRSRIAGAAALVLTSTLLAACSGDDAAAPTADGGTVAPAADEEQEVAPLRVSTNVKRATVPVDHELEVTARNGSLTKVTVTSGEGKLAGKLAQDGSAWTATGRLEPGQQYVVRAVGEDAEGSRRTETDKFSTDDLTLDEQTYPSVAPLGGETVGVGMPVIVTFDVPVTDKASFERHMTVDSAPEQPGSWHWMSDYEARWRPKAYWKPGTDVSVDVDINSVDAGNGIYGQESRKVDFTVGDANIYKVNMDTHQMQVFSNGSLLRTIPITTGEEPAFTTRSGVKVIIEKFDSKRMNSETVGIDPNSPDGYNIGNVQYAMRVTYSGEFVHAAPWSVGSQGSANVSHGCTGMSTENAAWLYNMTKRGDVVEYTGTDRWMTLDNGYGDWNASYAEYRKGSALS
ncbi:Ig-like domain-containing protein [Nocardioides sp. GXQ0305]|uniref:L,D-transpeptidase n=1 Tax=Nocardioides sp. GXQ0305 TaxID=3423912 RepID=UPI003D7C93F7